MMSRDEHSDEHSDVVRAAVGVMCAQSVLLSLARSTQDARRVGEQRRVVMHACMHAHVHACDAVMMRVCMQRERDEAWMTRHRIACARAADMPRTHDVAAVTRVRAASLRHRPTVCTSCTRSCCV